MRVPDKWSEVSLKQYIEITDVVAIDMDELDKQVKILSILTKESEDDICAIPLPRLKEAIRACAFIYGKPELKATEDFIKIGGKRFRINKMLNTISGAEYIDMTSLVKDPKQITANLPKIIAIFLHPVNIFGFKQRKYYDKGFQTLESRMATAKLIEDNLMMDKVMNLSGFFLRSWEALTKATLHYSDLQMIRARKSLKKLLKGASLSIGRGI